MEHDDLDNIFKNIIQNDNSALSDKEAASKERIWKAMDRPQKNIRFSWWQAVAAVLLMLMIGGSYFFSKKMKAYHQKYLELELNYNNVNTKLKELEKTLQNRPKEKEEVVVFENTIPKIIEKETVYIYDTVWMEKTIVTDPLKVIERDTIFIEVPQKKSREIVESKIEQPEQEVIKPKTKKPSKVEFVFDQKKRVKPTQKNRLIQINENGVAKKPGKPNPGVITIPIKN